MAGCCGRRVCEHAVSLPYRTPMITPVATGLHQHHPAHGSSDTQVLMPMAPIMILTGANGVGKSEWCRHHFERLRQENDSQYTVAWCRPNEVQGFGPSWPITLNEPDRQALAQFIQRGFSLYLQSQNREVQLALESIPDTPRDVNMSRGMARCVQVMGCITKGVECVIVDGIDGAWHHQIWDAMVDHMVAQLQDPLDGFHQLIWVTQRYNHIEDFVWRGDDRRVDVALFRFEAPRLVTYLNRQDLKVAIRSGFEIR